MLSTGKVILIVGITGMVLSAAIAVFCTRAFRRSEKKVKESIWKEYK